MKFIRVTKSASRRKNYYRRRLMKSGAQEPCILHCNCKLIISIAPLKDSEALPAQVCAITKNGTVFRRLRDTGREGWGAQAAVTEEDCFIHSGHLFSAPPRNLLRGALSRSSAKEKCLRSL